MVCSQTKTRTEAFCYFRIALKTIYAYTRKLMYIPSDLCYRLAAMEFTSQWKNIPVDTLDFQTGLQ